MEHSTINDLPNELLEMIFHHLDVEDLKDASLVCKRWSDMAFSGRRMDRVMLKPQFPWGKDLLQSKRKYRHLDVMRYELSSTYVKETCNISSLHMKDSTFDLSYSSLRLILLEVPNLQHLSIRSNPTQENKMSEPFPIMRKLERLEIGIRAKSSVPPWHTIAPSLQGLSMYCVTEDLLEQWRLFSGQLKQIFVTFYDGNLLNCFSQILFSLLEELSVKSIFSSDGFTGRDSLFMRNRFFRRNTSLRRLRLCGIYLSKTLVQDITNHNNNLTSLEFIFNDHYYGEQGCLESLAQLTELKHLRLKYVNTSMFLGCKALTLLQSLFIDDAIVGNKNTLGFLEDLLKIAPQLRCLELGSSWLRDMDVHFICNNFSKLTRLQMKYSDELSRDCLSGIDRLPHLLYFELILSRNRLSISIIPKNKVRYLTLHLDYQYDERDLLRLPKSFPQLDRLNLIINGECLHESTVDKLRRKLSTCAIKTYGLIITNEGMKRHVRRWSRSEMMTVWEKEWVWKNRI